VLVNGTGAEVTATGEGNTGMTESAKLCTDEIVRRTDLPHQSVVGFRVSGIGAVDLDGVGTEATNFCTHAVQNFQKQADVGNVGNVLDPTATVNEQGGRENSNSGILGTADRDNAGKRLSATDKILFHIDSSQIIGEYGRFVK
jgi:hypothetical protein